MAVSRATYFVRHLERLIICILKSCERGSICQRKGFVLAKLCSALFKQLPYCGGLLGEACSAEQTQHRNHNSFRLPLHESLHSDRASGLAANR
jgi:hypothetical protein